MRVRQDVIVNIPQSITKTLIAPEEALVISAVFRLAHDLMQPIDVHSDLHSSWKELRIVTEYDRCLLVPSRIRDIAAEYADVEVLS